MANRKSQSASTRAWPLPALSRNVLLIFGIALVLLALFPFWGSVSVAGVFAFGLYPLVRKAIDRFGQGRRKIITALCVAVLALFMLLPVTFFTLRLVSLATSKEGNASGAFSSQTLEKMGAAKEKVEKSLVSYGVKAKVFRSEEQALESIRGNSEKVMKTGVALISGLLTAAPDIFLVLLVFCLFLYLFLSRARQIRDACVKLGVVPAREIDRIAKVLQDSCYNSIVSSLLIGLIQSAVVVAGARIGGYREVVLIFTVVFFFSFIPFIGTAPVAFLLAGLSLLNHNNSSAIILGVTGIVAGTVDNVIRPYLVANGENEVHPIVSFAVIIGAIGILGIKGIFLGPVILTATVGLLNLPPKSESRLRTVAVVQKTETKHAG